MSKESHEVVPPLHSFSSSSSSEKSWSESSTKSMKVNDIFSSFRDVIDERRFSRDRGGFIKLRRSIWTSRSSPQDVSDTSGTGRSGRLGK